RRTSPPRRRRAYAEPWGSSPPGVRGWPPRGPLPQSVRAGRRWRPPRHRVVHSLGPGRPRSRRTRSRSPGSAVGRSSLVLLAGPLFGWVDTPHDDRVGAVVVTASHTDLFETEIGVELLGTRVGVTYFQEHVRADTSCGLVEQLGEQGAAHPPAPAVPGQGPGLSVPPGRDATQTRVPEDLNIRAGRHLVHG